MKGDKDKPASGAMVVLVPDAPLREDQANYKVASSDQNGNFSISAIPPGQYKLFAWEGVEMGQWTDAEFLQTWESKGKTVVFKEKSKETADLTLLNRRRSGRLRLPLSSARSRPLLTRGTPYAKVELQSSSGAEYNANNVCTVACSY